MGSGHETRSEEGLGTHYSPTCGFVLASKHKLGQGIRLGGRLFPEMFPKTVHRRLLSGARAHDDGVHYIPQVSS